MPELPEVESLRQILQRSVVGRTIVGTRIGRLPLRRKATGNFGPRIRGRRIEKIGRRAKYLILDLDGDDVILVHLGMSGSLTRRDSDFDSSEFDRRHDHVEFQLDNGTRLVFNDPRRFGIVRLVARAALPTLREMKGLGPEPFSDEFNADYLANQARGRKVAIKNLIMDQRIVAGVGNIYASEVLYRAGVRPTRRAGRLKRAETERVARFIPIILRDAIDGRGTTFRNYRDSEGRPGTFADRLRVYGREGEKCYRCSAVIKNVVVGQRASFYCPTCQK
jgi:formamidopyrimidine-DNA glycosylase